MKKDIFINNLKKSSVILTAALVISGFFVANFALAAATVTPASGGTNISIDTTSAGESGTFTELEGPAITENVAGDIVAGIHTIILPSGWEFDIESSITIFKFGGNIVLNSTSVTPTQTDFSFEVNSQSTSVSTLGFSGLKVRPTGTTPSTDNMTYSGDGIVGVDGDINFGTLSTVAGTVTQLTFTTQPGDTEYGSVLSPHPVIETQDQFGNHSTSGLSGSETVELVLDGTGLLGGTKILGIGTGVATFTDLTVDSVGVDNTLVASATGLTSVESEHFTITPAPLIITADAQTKIYGVVNPALTVSYDGLVGGDTDTVVSGLSVTTLADTATPAGTVAITPSGATAANYSISFVPGVLTITQAPLTITAYAQTKVYGEIDLALTYVTIPDPLLNEDILTGSLSRDEGENVGTYAIEQGDLDNSNYDITFVSADLTIDQKALTVTAVTDTKIYDGDTISAAIPTITGSLAFSDTAGFTQTYDNKNVGTGKTLTPSGIVNDGNSGLNYSYDFVNDLTGVVTQAPLTITADDKTKVYGEANPALTASYDGLVGGDTSAVVSGLSIEVAANTTTPAGTVDIITSGATATNYSISFASGVLTITQAPLTVTADAQSKTYGDGDLEFTYTSDGLINGDELSGSLSRVAGENVGTYAITLGNLDNSNYNINFVSADLTIDQKALTVTAVTDTKIYDGNTTSDETPTITGSLVPGDTTDFIQTYDDKNVGETKTLTPSGVVNDGNSGLNYSYDFVNDLTGVITQASLTATVTVSNKVVDGSTSAIITGRTLIGVISGDEVATNEDGTATFADANIGNDKIVTATGITITGADAGNYSYDGTATGTGNILPIPTVVYVDDSWIGTTAWVDPDGAGLATAFSYDAFATIQEGIVAVADTGTVNVAAGTYAESITVNKQLSIIGAGNTATIIQPEIDTDGVVVTADNVIIKDLKVGTSNSGITPNKAISVEEADNLEINNIVVETTGDKAMGIWIGGSSNSMDPVSGLTIIKSDITVNNEATGIYAAHSNPAHSGWTIGGNSENANTVTALLGNVIELYDVTDSEVSHNTITTSALGGSAVIWSSELSDISNLVFSYNNVDYSGGSQVAFITDFPVTDTTDTTISTVTITENTFSNWGSRALRIGDGDGSDLGTVTGVTITSNTFNMSVDSEVIGGTDAGSATGAENTFNVQEPAEIQDAIDSAFSGDTINVAAGIYDEQIVITKSLTLQGAGDTTVIKPSGPELVLTASIPWISGSTKAMAAIVSVEMAGDEITIKDLKIDGSLITSKSTLWVGGLVYLETSGKVEGVTVIGNPALPDRTAGIFAAAVTQTSLVEITGCTVIGYNRAGIYALGGEFTADYHHNEINGPGSISTGVPNGMFFLEGAKGSATYNIVTDLGYTGEEYRSTGIGTYNAGINIVFSNNEISYVQNAFALSNNTIGTRVEYNDVHDCHTGVRIEAGATDSIIQYNDIYDNEFAIRCGPDMGDGNVANYNYLVGNSGVEWTNEGEGQTYTGAVSNVHDTYIIGATYNWWGSDEGPIHLDNPFGGGDTVSDNVGYRPWCTDAECNVLDEVAPETSLSGTPSDPTSQTTAGITVGGEGVVYYKYELDDGGYGAETAVGTLITLSELSEGSHTIDVLGRDQAGNWQSVATTYTWEVDTTVPTLSPVSIDSDNANTALAKAGDTITLTLTSSENIQTPTVTIAGNSATVTGTDTSWTATYVMASEDGDGVVAFTIDFTDLAGNNGATVMTVDDASSVTFDKTAPAVTITSIAGDEYINNSEKGTIHVIGTAEANSTVNVSLTGGATVSGSGTATGGNYDITIDGTTLTDGTITPSVTATDAVGNTSSALVIPTAVKDIVAPTVISHTPGINAINVESGVVTITFSENIIVEAGDITFSPSATFVISGSGIEIVTLTPDSILNSNTVYTITVTTNTTDEAGNGLAEAYDWQFTTATLYDIALNANNGGWNLISLPVVPNDANISTVLGDAESNIEAVWTYDPLHPNAIGGWLVYVPGNSPETNNISTMTAGYGYWISVMGNTHISGSGGLLSAGPTTPPSRNLTTGWNLVGYYQIPGEDSSVPANAFASLGGTAGLSALYGFNNSFGSFVDVTTILPGDAFWISLPSEKIYTPSNIGSN